MPVVTLLAASIRARRARIPEGRYFGVDTQRVILKILSRLPQSILRRMAGAPIEGRGARLDLMSQVLWAAGKKQPALETQTPAEVRAGLEAAARTLQVAVPDSVDVRDDAIPTPAGGLDVRVYTPRDAGENAPLTLFFHFGGYVIGSWNICHGFCGTIAALARTIVASVDYRLAPENPFPAPIEDAFAAYRWALDYAEELGADATRIVVAGDSAGAMSAAVIAQEANRQAWPPPRCQVLIYPWLVPNSRLPSYSDFADAYPLTANIMRWFEGHYFRSEEEKQHVWAAPLDAPDLRGLPEALIFTSGFDPLRDEGELYAKRLRDAGVPVEFQCFEHLTHSFTMLGGVVPAAQRACEEIARKLGRRLHENGSSQERSG